MRLPRLTHTYFWSWSYLLRFHSENTLFIGEQVCGRDELLHSCLLIILGELYLFDLIWVSLFLSPHRAVLFVPGAERHLSSSLSLDRCHIQISSTHLNTHSSSSSVTATLARHCTLIFRSCDPPFLLLGTPSHTSLTARSPTLQVQYLCVL